MQIQAKNGKLQIKPTVLETRRLQGAAEDLAVIGRNLPESGATDAAETITKLLEQFDGSNDEPGLPGGSGGGEAARP